jgi:hypothetical protein
MGERTLEEKVLIAPEAAVGMTLMNISDRMIRDIIRFDFIDILPGSFIAVVAC